MTIDLRKKLSFLSLQIKNPFNLKLPMAPSGCRGIGWVIYSQNHSLKEEWPNLIKSSESIRKIWPACLFILEHKRFYEHADFCRAGGQFDELRHLRTYETDLGFLSLGGENVFVQILEVKAYDPIVQPVGRGQKFEVRLADDGVADRGYHRVWHLVNDLEGKWFRK